MGLLDPTGLHLALHWENKEGESYENLLAAMGALLHERTHWLQVVGTCAGQFSSWLGGLQSGLLFDQRWARDPLTAADLPLLDSARLPKHRRTLWLACERIYAATFGAERAYCDYLDGLGCGFQQTEISEQLRRLGSSVVRSHDSYESHQDKMASAAPHGDKVMMFDDGGVALGAIHCMEGGARLNEIFRLSAGIQAQDTSMNVDEQAYFFPPYSNIRDIYFDSTGREPGRVEDEVAICVLADWALNCPLPPFLPLKAVLGENAAFLPGPFFVLLTQQIDIDAIPPQPEEDSVTWAEGLVQAIYSQIVEKTGGGIATPLQMAKAYPRVMPGLEDMGIPESLYAISDEEQSLSLADNASRLRYLAILSLRAAKTRLAHPAFFPFPYAYYATDRKFFHELWDPIQPPLISIGRERLVPTSPDPGWFQFFYLAAIQNEIGIFAADSNCAALGSRLAGYRGTLLKEADEIALMKMAVTGFFGDGEAARETLAAAGVA